MTIINLRDFYYWYTQDEYIEVSDDVAEALRASVRSEAAYTERARYNKAYYSLNADDGIEYLRKRQYSVHFKFADEFRRIAEYIEINTTDTAEAG